jgi:phosphoribosylaminoimidazole-succinocarboxamide synthase
MAEKNLIYSGKSKSVYSITEGFYAGKYQLVFKDGATGFIDIFL